MTPHFCQLDSLSRVGFILIGEIVVIGFFQNEIRRSLSWIPARKRLGLAARGIATAIICLCICAASTKPAGTRHVEITAKRFSFEPAVITVNKGESVEVVLRSNDVPHGLRIRELNLDLHAQKGKSATAIISPQNPGVFVGHCSVFCGAGHGQMTLTIRVVG